MNLKKQKIYKSKVAIKHKIIISLNGINKLKQLDLQLRISFNYQRISQNNIR